MIQQSREANEITLEMMDGLKTQVDELKRQRDQIGSTPDRQQSPVTSISLHSTSSNESTSKRSRSSSIDERTKSTPVSISLVPRRITGSPRDRDKDEQITEYDESSPKKTLSLNLGSTSPTNSHSFPPASPVTSFRNSNKSETSSFSSITLTSSHRDKSLPVLSRSDDYQIPTPPKLPPLSSIIKTRKKKPLLWEPFIHQETAEVTFKHRITGQIRTDVPLEIMEYRKQS